MGQTESPLLIRPYIDDITTSEMHAIMTAGFGTIAGSVMGAYMEFGVSVAIEKILLICCSQSITRNGRGTNAIIYTGRIQTTKNLGCAKIGNS